MSTYSSFIFKSGPCKGCPIGHLFAKLDKGLHLNLSGRQILTEVQDGIKPQAVFGLGQGCQIQAREG